MSATSVALYGGPSVLTNVEAELRAGLADASRLERLVSRTRLPPATRH